ncbi:MAG: hypothetical protein MHM6MM_005478 [Cercozoa sp. M6MM]
MSGKYPFPLLGLSELVNSLRQLGLSHVTPQLLKQPTAEFVEKVYDCFLEALLGIPRARWSQINFKAQSALEHPQLHESSVGITAFLRRLSHLMRKIGVDNFSCNDVWQPSPAVTRRNLSALLNFVKFRERNVDVYKRLRAEATSLEDELAELHRQNAALAAQVETLQRQRDAEQPQRESLDQEHAELDKKLAPLRTRLFDRQREVQQVTATLADRADQLRRVKDDAEVAEAKTAELKSRVVHSPLRIRRDLDLREQSVRELSQRVRTREPRIHRKEEQVQMLRELTKELHDLTPHVDRVEQEQKTLASLDSQIRGLHEQATQLRVKTKALEKEHAGLEEYLRNTARQLKAQEAQFKQKHEANQHTLSELRLQLLNDEAKTARDTATAQANRQLLKQQEQQLSAHYREHRRQKETLLREYGALLGALRQYHATVQQQLPASFTVHLGEDRNDTDARSDSGGSNASAHADLTPGLDTAENEHVHVARALDY